jgi:hypothetical protein
MIGTLPVRMQPVSYATVPLSSEYLSQASLFDKEVYPLPKVLPGQEAVIVDADEWQHNFKRGRVLSYSYVTGLHTILFDSVSASDFYGREIIQAKKEEDRSAFCKLPQKGWIFVDGIGYNKRYENKNGDDWY